MCRILTFETNTRLKLELKADCNRKVRLKLIQILSTRIYTQHNTSRSGPGSTVEYRDPVGPYLLQSGIRLEWYD